MAEGNSIQLEADAGRGALRAIVRSRWLSIDPAWRWALTLFLGYRALFSIWAAWVSSMYPRYVEEVAITIWPINTTLDYWLQRTLLWPFARYDVIWYIGIAEQGYAYRAGSTAFHPLYPLLIGGLGRLFGGNYLLAGWLIAQVCCVCMLALLYRLVLLDYDEGTARRTTLFLLGSPLGFSFLLPYTESLLLLCIVGAFYAARRGRWLLAGLAGASAALTKQPGVVLVLPLLWELWLQQRAQVAARRFGPLARALLALALTPLGLLAYMVYRATLGDVAFSWREPGSLIGLLVTPSYDDIWGQYFSWPWVNFVIAVEKLRAAPYFYLFLNTFGMLIMSALTCYAALRQRLSYAVYGMLLLVMSLSVVYPFLPYMAILRRFVIIFPLFIQLAVWGRSRRYTALILGCNTFLWVYISEAYVRNAFVP